MVLGHDILTSDRTQDIKISENVSFDSMLLSPKILKGLKASGFYVPSPIQLHGIPLGKCGFDLLLEAKSGTGKTAVFSIIALEKLNLDKGLQTLMLAPTREIASQICDVIKTIGAYYEGLSVEVVMGGLPFQEDVEKFKKTVHIVVGSPGRLYHLIKYKHIDVSTVRLMVLDEADKLLEKCFLSDINNIYSLLPSLKQMIMSSATYPDDIKTTMKNYVLNAHHICPDSNSVLLGIEQNVTVVSSHVNIMKQTKNRYAELNKILTKIKFKQCLIFCNYQVRVGEVHKMLINDEWPADKLHGKQEQTDRLDALKILQEYKCRILVCTDLAARGIDASNVDLVVNFEIPFDWQTYLHRIGRAGRFGSYGSAITILSEDEQNKFRVRLRSLEIPFNLRHLWSKEPFLLDMPEIAKENLPEEHESLPKVKESVKKLEMKDTYDKLCEVLSLDSIQLNNENHDVPTFESLCDSFEQANRDSKIDSVESFSDLCSSFQSHEIKSNENLNCKPVEDKKLIIPCNMFNGNIILQSFQKHKSAASFTNNNFDSGNKMKEKNIEIDEADDKKSSKSQDEKLRNGKPSGSRHKQSETVLNDASLPSTSKSSENNTTMKSQGSRKAEINENSYSRFGKIESATRKVFPEISDNENYCDKSASIGLKLDDDHVTPFISSEYNDCERALLAANLPIAFGKTKPNMQSTTNRDISKKTHFSRNRRNIRNNEYQVSTKNKTLFTKSYVKQQSDSVYESSDSYKTEDESVSQSHQLLCKKSSERGKSIDHSNHKRNITVPTKINVKQRAEIVNESSDTDKTEDKSITQSYKPLKSKKSYKDNSLHIKNKTVPTKGNVKKEANFAYESSEDEKTEIESVSLPYRSHIGKITSNSNKTTRKPINYNHSEKNDFKYHVHSSVIQERQRQFDCWYQELQANTQALEKMVYIEEITRLNRLY